MTDITNRVLPPPKNWQDFERLCYDLFRHMWKTNDAEMHGRQGQPQAGVDVYGTDLVEKRFVGVQCKGKDQGYGGALTEQELNAEIEKAKTFEPALAVFIVATTAPNDVAIQRVARTITQVHEQQGLFEVRVQGWETLQQRITDHPEVLSKHFHDLAPVDVLERIDVGIAVTEREGEQTRTEFAGLKTQVSFLAERIDAGDPLQARIIDAARLTDDGSARAAIRRLQQILKDERSALSPRNVFRLRAGLGVAHLAVGEILTAIQHFHEAYEADPGWPNARAFQAIAELLEGNPLAAFERAKQALADDPTSHHAAAVIIDAAPSEIGITELQALIPEGLRDRAEVSLGLSLRARKNEDFPTAEDFARRALASQPNDIRALAAVAEVVLQPILASEGIGFTRLIPAEARGRFNEALDLLQRAWEQLATRDDIARYDHIVVNLITALDIAGRKHDAERILDQALRIASCSPLLLRRHAQKMAEAADWREVLTTIASLPANDVEPQDELVKVQALIQTGSAETALTEARALREKLTDDRLREAAAALSLNAAAQLGSLTEELTETLSRSPKSIVLRSVGVGLLDEAHPRRQTLLAELDDLIDQIQGIQDRYHLAEALFAAKQYSKAADLYAELHGTDKDEVALRRHLAALHLADRRLEARRLFDSLDEQIKSLPQYAEAGAAIYERAGLLAECRLLLEKLLLHEDNLHRRLQWLSLCERLSDTDTVVDWLKQVNTSQQGHPGDLIFLALRIDWYLADPKCLPIAYRALRGAYDDPQIHLGFIALFLTGRVRRNPIEPPEQVGPDTAVALVEKDGPRRLTRIIETEPNPRIDRDEIAPDDSLATRLIGLRVGGEVELRTIAAESPRYVVSAIQNKYLHAHVRSLEQFQVMFPESRAFGSLSIDPSKGDQQFKPIFDAVKQKGEFGRQIRDLHRSGHLPIAIAAKFGGTSGFEFWDAIFADEAMQFNVVLGRQEDYAESLGLLSQQTHRAVIDPITLYGLVRLKIAETVREAFDDLAVVQTTLDSLRRVLQEREADRGREKGILAWDGEHYQMVRLAPEAIEQRVADIQEVLSFAETLTLVPAEAVGELTNEAREVFNDLDPAFLDTIFAARGNDRILLCDDRPFRTLSTEALQIKSVWTHAAVTAAVNKTVLPEEYFRISNILAESRYFYTTLNAGNLFYEWKRSNWTMTPTLQVLLDLLARPTNAPQGVMNVLANLAQIAWANKPQKRDDEAFEHLVGAIFVAFKKAEPECHLQVLADMMSAPLLRFVRSRFDGPFQYLLQRSTYYTPVENIVAEVHAIQESIVAAIVQAFARALLKAMT